MADSPASDPPETPITFNVRSATRAQTVAQQIEDIASIQVEPDQLPRTFEELPRITLITTKGPIEYVNSDLLTSVRPKRSWIWEHGYDLREVRSKDTYWKCKMHRIGLPRSLARQKLNIIMFIAILTL